MISVDTEVSGLDIYSGCRPYFVTICFQTGHQIWFDWDVDPLTRQPNIPNEDVQKIKSIIEDEQIVAHNAKFDITALTAIGVDNWNWDNIHDTMYAAHILASNRPKNLTDLTLHYLRKNIQPYEDRLKQACQQARRYCRSRLKNWRIAKEGDPMLPSAKGSSDKNRDPTWKNDGWLPKVLYKHLGREKLLSEYDCDKSNWLTVLEDYANADSASTIVLWSVMEKLLHQRNLWKYYEARLKVLREAYYMEARGATLNKPRLEKLHTDYRKESQRLGEVCTSLARGLGYELTLPKSGNNKSLREFMFDPRYLGLPTVKVSEKTGDASLDKNVLEKYENCLESGSKAVLFIKSLRGKRKCDTSTLYLENYVRFWQPLSQKATFRSGLTIISYEDSWFRIHPSINPTGTDTLRWSFSNPNSSNFSKQPDQNDFTLRYCFGPAPGREWWPIDYQNLELRIPTFEAEETELIEVFNHPRDPPYYGSYHLVVFDLLYPELFAKYGKKCKDEFEHSYYQWVKNGNFAIVYGAQEEKADQTYHIKGAYQKIRRKFPKIAALNQRMIAYAAKYGYVETIPDVTVDSQRGYPLLCTRSEQGGIVPTTPLNFHVSGTAMWIATQAVVYCGEQCRQWSKDEGRDYFITLQVHDEIVFDFPTCEGAEPWKANWPKIKILKGIMEQCGRNVNVPTPVAVSYVGNNLAEKQSVEV